MLQLLPWLDSSPFLCKPSARGRAKHSMGSVPELANVQLLSGEQRDVCVNRAFLYSIFSVRRTSHTTFLLSSSKGKSLYGNCLHIANAEDWGGGGAQLA